jgi:branched-chain amino acid transport system substrate-binding protein
MPRGPVRFNHLGNRRRRVHPQMRAPDGQLVNTIIKRYHDLSQFWTYDEKAFLANPVYTRDCPPARDLEP